MPSAKFKTLAAATSAGEPALELVEINQPDLLAPIRFVNDNQDITCNGALYRACAFSLTWPDDKDGSIPQAQITFDNVGREMTDVIEAARGLPGAKATLRMVMRSEPDVSQFEITLDLANIHVGQMSISGTLGFSNMLDVPAVMVRYTPDRAPGIF